MILLISTLLSFIYHPKFHVDNAILYTNSKQFFRQKVVFMRRHSPSRWYWIIIITLLVSCGNNGTSGLPTIPAGENPTDTVANGTPTSNGDAVTISYAAYDYERDTYINLAKQFSETHPNINVVITSLDDATQLPPDKSGNYPTDSTMNMLRRVASTADTAPSSWVTQEAIGTPLVLDMKPYMDADTGFDRSDFYPGILERYTQNDSIYILPRNISIQSLAYNQDLFATESVANPIQSWSYADLLATAEKFAKKENNTITRYGWYDNGGNFALLYFLEQAGVDLLAMKISDLKANDTRIIDAYKKYADLINRGVIYTQPMYAMADGMGAEKMSDPGYLTDPTQLIREGKIAIWNEGALFTGDPTSPAPPFTVGHAVLPFTKASDLNLGSEGYMISGGTKHPAEAWTFIEWLSRQSVTTFSGPVYPGYLNARKSLNATQTASEFDDKQRQSDYEYTLANLPPLANYPNQDYTVAYSILGSTSMLFETPPKTAEEILASTVQSLVDNYVNSPYVTPSPTPDIRPIMVATPEAQVAGPDQTTISFASYGSSLSDMRRLLKNFKTQEPGIFVKLIQTDNITTTMTISDAAQRSDCFWWNQGIPVAEQDIAALADLQPLLDADSDITTSDIGQGLFDIYRNNGRLIGFPHSYSTRGLVYQPALLSAVGITAPTAEWTPDDFLKAAKAVTANGVFGYSSMGNYTGDVAFWANRFGGSLVLGTGKNARANYTDPNTIKAIAWWLELSSMHNVMPKPVFDYRRDTTNSTADTSWELQSQGKIAMWFDTSLGSYDPANVSNDPTMTKPPFLAAMAPPPVGTIGLLSSDLYMLGYHVSADAADPQACMRVINYMSQQANVNAYGNIPARTAQAQDALFEEQNRYILPLRDALAPLMEKPLNVTTDSNSQYMVEQYWLIEALDTVLNKKADLAGALTKAQTATNTYMECVANINPNAAAGNGDTSASCAKKADPTYMGYMTDEANPVSR